MYKQIIIVRRDLKIGQGKLIVQCIHASIGSMKLVNKQIIKNWEFEGNKKVVLKVNSLQEMKQIESRIKKVGIPYFLVKDAGLTQLKAGTVTALGIGPVKERDVDKITGKLKLL